MMDIEEIQTRNPSEVAVVLGNAPSIKSLDLNKITGSCVIGLNGSPILEKYFSFKHSYYAMGDIRFLKDSVKRVYCSSKYLDADVVRVVRSDLRAFDLQEERHRTCYVKSLGRIGFSDNLKQGFYHGCTTVLLAMQIAAYVRCSKIVLLGVDLRYNMDTPRFYRERVVHKPDDLVSYQIYSIYSAARHLKEMGVEVVSCSEKSYLRPYLDYQNFDSLFGG